MGLIFKAKQKITFLDFTLPLLFLPPELAEYGVPHELCSYRFSRICLVPCPSSCSLVPLVRCSRTFFFVDLYFSDFVDLYFSDVVAFNFYWIILFEVIKF